MRWQRRGFTLVELLVVAGLIVAMFTLVLSGRQSSKRSSPIRSAQEFASMLLATQSLALGRPEGSAILVEADVGDSRLGAVIHDGTMLPPIVRDLLQDGRIVPDGVVPPFPDPLPPPDAELANGYKVRFRENVGGSSFMTTSPWLALRDSTVALRASAGQTAANTLIKPLYDNGKALIVRYPTKGDKSLPLSSTPLRIDLRHSGVGDLAAASHGYGRFEGLSPIALVFDQAGRVAEVIQKVGVTGPTAVDPIVPSEVIYFLFAERSAIDDDTSLSSELSVWVAVNPQTGRINVSGNTPAAGTDIVTARDRARKAIAFGK